MLAVISLFSLKKDMLKDLQEMVMEILQRCYVSQDSV
jgi:hypothetical protein